MSLLLRETYPSMVPTQIVPGSSNQNASQPMRGSNASEDLNPFPKPSSKTTMATYSVSGSYESICVGQFDVRDNPSLSVLGVCKLPNGKEQCPSFFEDSSCMQLVPNEVVVKSRADQK